MQNNWFAMFKVKQGQTQSEGLCNRNMTISAISSKLLIHFVTKLGFMVYHLKPEYSVKNWFSVFKGKVTTKD